MMKISVGIFVILCIMTGCKDYMPKPVGDNRIDREESQYKEYNFPRFAFQYSDIIRIDTLASKSPNEYWFNIAYPDYDAAIYCTYLSITSNALSKVLEDSYYLAYSHSLKANGINQMTYSDEKNHKGGVLYEIEGNVATPLQFFITDSVSNFLRGSLYYTQKVNIDSVAPITALIKNDIMEMISTIRFKNKNKPQ